MSDALFLLLFLLTAGLVSIGFLLLGIYLGSSAHRWVDRSCRRGPRDRDFP